MVHLLMGGERGPQAARLLEQDPEWAAPPILISELRNVLVGYVRRGVMSPDQARELANDAAAVLGNRISSAGSGHVVGVALECGLSAYDAEFVALARTLGTRLVTMDAAVLRGASDVAVPIHRPPGE